MYGHRHWPHPRGGDASDFAGRALGSPPPAAIGQRGSGVSRHDALRLSRGPKESCTRAARSPGCAFRRGGHPSDAVNLHVFEWGFRGGSVPSRSSRLPAQSFAQRHAAGGHPTGFRPAAGPAGARRAAGRAQEGRARPGPRAPCPRSLTPGDRPAPELGPSAPCSGTRTPHAWRDAIFVTGPGPADWTPTSPTWSGDLPHQEDQEAALRSSRMRTTPQDDPAPVTPRNDSPRSAPEPRTGNGPGVLTAPEPARAEAVIHPAMTRPDGPPPHRQGHHLVARRGTAG